MPPTFQIEIDPELRLTELTTKPNHSTRQSLSEQSTKYHLEQLTYLAHKLAAIRGRLTLEMSRENDEALQLGRQLRQLFDNCGWSVDWRLVRSALQEKEIVVRLPTADRLSKAHSVLVDSLNEIRLSPVLATSDEVPKNEAILAIGSLGFATSSDSNDVGSR